MRSLAKSTRFSAFVWCCFIIGVFLVLNQKPAPCTDYSGAAYPHYRMCHISCKHPEYQINNLKKLARSPQWRAKGVTKGVWGPSPGTPVVPDFLNLRRIFRCYITMVSDLLRNSQEIRINLIQVFLMFVEMFFSSPKVTAWSIEG